ncbi:hypothetical protein [Streptomyces hypolithicus]
MATETARPAAPLPSRALFPLVLPALLIGVGASLVLLAVSYVSEGLQDWLWDTLPRQAGFAATSWWWTLAVLTATGIAVGTLAWKFPGHAGPDPATMGLVDPPLPVRMLPGILLAVVVGLAGGVSLGPENPITATNIALAYVLGRAVMPRAPGAVWVELAAAGTIGPCSARRWQRRHPARAG